MNIAIFGGSFNPVHRGHLTIVKDLLETGGMSRIIIVPAFQNPLKNGPPAIPEAVRWDMLVATFHQFSAVEISAYEMEKREKSYSYKTLRHFKHRFPDSSLFLVLGEDAFASFGQWIKIDTILSLAKILVIPRPGLRPSDTTVPYDHGYSTHVTWLDIDIPDISATQIRQSAVETVAAANWLHPDALKIWQAYCTSNQ